MSSAGLDWQLCFVGSVLRKQCRSVQRRMLRVSAACLHRHGFEGTHAHAHTRKVLNQAVQICISLHQRKFTAYCGVDRKFTRIGSKDGPIFYAHLNIYMYRTEYQNLD